MIDSPCLTYVDLGNYLMHHRNYCKIIELQQRQSRSIRDKYKIIVTAHAERMDQMEKMVDRLQKIDENNLDQIKYLFESRRSSDNIDLSKQSKTIIETVISKVYKLEIRALEAMQQRYSENLSILICLVETDLSSFKELESCCGLVMRLLEVYFQQFSDILKSRITIVENKSFLEIELLLEKHKLADV